MFFQSEPGKIQDWPVNEDSELRTSASEISLLMV